MSELSNKVKKLLIQYQNTGKQKYMEELYELTANHLLIIARKYLKDKSMERDAVQEGFIKLIRNIDSFDDKQDGYNWMCKIVQNAALTLNIKIKPENLCEDVPETPEDSLTDLIDTQTDIGNAMAQLDEDSRKMIYFYFYKGYTYRKLSELFDVPSSTICKRMKQAMKKLKIFLKR